MVFVVVMVIIVGGLISLNNESRKARSVHLITDNLAAAIDSMSRNIRMGSYYHCGCGVAGVGGGPVTTLDVQNGVSDYPNLPRDCPMDLLGNGGDQCFAFESQSGNSSITTDQYVYRLNNRRIQRSKDGGATFIDLTAPEVSINSLQFLVQGTLPDNHQPLVTLIIRGTATVTPKTSTDFNVQTTLGSRTPNYSVYTP